MPSYTHWNGARIVTIDSVTSFRSMYAVWKRLLKRRQYGVNARRPADDGVDGS